uniref:Uncharacterized protein n=1 Tax=Anguilla anguilla TaxID=7936 RepID=A0A0E9T650_ANGAN
MYPFVILLGTVYHKYFFLRLGL